MFSKTLIQTHSEAASCNVLSIAYVSHLHVLVVTNKADDSVADIGLHINSYELYCSINKSESGWS